jgi:hypothetical protein
VVGSVPAHAAKAFEGQQFTEKEARLQQENTRHEQFVGELPLDLERRDEWLA